ncbi:MAG: tyrosine-type recombinase/integrase [Kofleriaceae bacterium]|nr:tyrosine-type recombinase/integrase [Kofleriaceae bacterium]
MIRRVMRSGVTRFQVYESTVRDGKRVKEYVGTYDSKREAETAAEDHRVTQRKIARGELPPEVDLKRTLRDAVDEWLASLKKNHSRSHDQYRVRMHRYVLPYLGSMPITSIANPHVMRWRDEQSTQFAPRTVNGNLTCMSSAFSYFKRMKWIPTNPCHGVPHVPTPERPYVWIQTREEMTKLLIACPRGIREIATVALGTGMRLDEVLHLHWADVDIERRLISVHRGRQGTVKSGRVRHIPILDALLPFLREQALQRDGATLVFTGEQGKPRTKPSVWFPFKQAVERAGLPKELRFHDLRHTFASHWVLDGGDIFRLSKILGHSNVTITQKVYAHLMPEAWEQDYHRVDFVIPETGTTYGLTKRKPSAPPVVGRRGRPPLPPLGKPVAAPALRVVP